MENKCPNCGAIDSTIIQKRGANANKVIVKNCKECRLAISGSNEEEVLEAWENIKIDEKGRAVILPNSGPPIVFDDNGHEKTKKIIGNLPKFNESIGLPKINNYDEFVGAYFKLTTLDIMMRSPFEQKLLIDFGQYAMKHLEEASRRK